MISKGQKKSRKKAWLLWAIIFSHIIPVIISAYKDSFIHSRHTNVKLSELRYWLWFLTWWSAWASLLAILWAIYRLFFLQKEKNSYRQQLVDLMVVETNLVSGLVFCLGGFILTMHQEGTIKFPFLGEFKMMSVWLFFNFFWHILAPGLVFYYFWKYCQVDKIVKKRKSALVSNLINPTIYLFYVLWRPEIIGYYNKLKGCERYQYPADYPYPFFFWIVGESSGGLEEENRNNKWFFWHSWPTWLKSLFWISFVVSVAYLGFSLLSHFLINFKEDKRYNDFNSNH